MEINEVWTVHNPVIKKLNILAEDYMSAPCDPEKEKRKWIDGWMEDSYDEFQTWPVLGCECLDIVKIAFFSHGTGSRWKSALHAFWLLGILRLA